MELIKTLIMQKLIIPIYFCISIIITTVLSCGKDHSTPIQEPSIPLNPDFPNNKGSWWKYVMYDSVYLTTDTILITVVDTTHLNNGTKVTIWKRVSLLNGTDSLYVDNKLS